MTDAPRRMRQQEQNYIASQMSDVNSTEPDVMMIAFRNPDFLGGTHWMNITQQQFKQIERILTLGRTER